MKRSNRSRSLAIAEDIALYLADDKMLVKQQLRLAKMSQSTPIFGVVSKSESVDSTRLRLHRLPFLTVKFRMESKEARKAIS